MGHTKESAGFLRYRMMTSPISIVISHPHPQFITGCSSLPPGRLANLHPGIHTSLSQPRYLPLHQADRRDKSRCWGRKLPLRQHLCSLFKGTKYAVLSIANRITLFHTRCRTIQVSKFYCTVLYRTVPYSQCFRMGGDEDNFVLFIITHHVIPFWDPYDQGSISKEYLWS